VFLKSDFLIFLVDYDVKLYLLTDINCWFIFCVLAIFKCFY